MNMGCAWISATQNPRIEKGSTGMPLTSCVNIKKAAGMLLRFSVKLPAPGLWAPQQFGWLRRGLQARKGSQMKFVWN